MSRILLFLALMCAGQVIHAQYVYTIKADSVKITNSCDTAELIIENHTQTVPGFLFNKGRGRTEFRRLLQNVNEYTFLIGGDTLNLSNFWMQGGNSFGATGLLGTKDNYPLTFLQNGVEKGRIATSGNWLFNTTQDNGFLAQLNGNTWTSGYMLFENNIHLACQNGVYGDSRINIGKNNYVVADAAIGIGKDIIVNGGFGVGRSNRVNGGIGIFGNSDGGIAIGFDSYAGPYSIAIGHKTSTTDVFQFVCGGANNGGMSPITDIYFGSGVRRNNTEGPGFSYTIHGSGAYGANNAGGNVTIAGGIGTGSGTPGSVIFSTTDSTSSGSAFQSLSERARIAANGNFGIGTIAPSAMLHVSGTSRFDNTVTTSGHRSAIRNISGNTAIGDTDEYIFADATNTAINITLPTATGRNGQTYTIKKVNEGNSVTITSNSSQLIDGMNSYSLISRYAFITVVASEGSWMIVSASKIQ